MEEEELDKMEMKVDPSSRTYCVTGATGYIGSCLVHTLLQRGYTVHATLRDPEKSLHLMSLWAGGDRLRLFKADLNEEGSFDEAVKGCDGVFHVAASMQFNVDEKNNIESYVQENIIDPAIKGTLNLLKSCLKHKNSVKRVVFTSSISTITAKDNDGKWKQIVDESCQVQAAHVWNTQTSGWVYALSKLESEEAAFKFAKEKEIDLVSVIATTVAGPFFTANVPSSLKVLLSPITGEPQFYKILNAVNSRMGSIALVHIEDTCNAHIFLMENDKAQGRYICSSLSCPLSKLANLLDKHYSNSNIKRVPEKNYDKVPCEISSKKLNDLGFSYKHGLEDIINQTIMCCLDYGYLPPIS
ncbi:hypothetical protein PIB30_001871 [Stylosanthes scabra]|uniref:NAD-dependent epimerase/dehydratase domain-containing protein n=1 Tax=Stylosanthes scabra TaxID=79078 RepID=A0ABU6X3R3_9FABA|nr:hypothetical protein [Stylosanthes scabra]